MTLLLMRAFVASGIAGGRAALSAIRREGGVIAVARVVGQLVWRRLRGEPFRGLSKAKNSRERQTRSQAEGVILLYRAASAVLGEEAAMRVARAAVRAGGRSFLSRLIPKSEGDGDIEAIATRAAGQFFNARGTLRAVSEREVAFDVHECLFVPLLAATGEPHLGRLFCEADDAFFGGSDTLIQLRRTETLATGASRCDFRFSWGEAPQRSPDPRSPDEGAGEDPSLSGRGEDLGAVVGR